MTFGLNAAIGAADRAAGAVWRECSAPTAFGWRDGLEVRSAQGLAQFVAHNRARTAADLYRFAVAGAETSAVPFERVPPALRVAIEVFRATFLVLLAELERSVRVGAPSVAERQPARRPTDAVPLRRPDPALEAEVVRLEQQWAGDTGRPGKRQRREGRS